MTSITIPESVTSIGSAAFSYCEGLTKAEFSSIESLCNIKFHSSSSNPLYYAQHLYIDDKEVTDLVIPETISYIRENTFVNCKGLNSVVIPDSGITIQTDAFKGCGIKKAAYPITMSNPFPDLRYTTFIPYNPEGAIIEDGWVWGPDKSIIYFAPLNLEAYIIPETVTSIGENAFARCDRMTSVSALWNIPVAIYDNSFEGLYDTVDLSVPSEAVNNYLVTNWSLFKNISLGNTGKKLKTFSDGVLEYRINPADMTATVIGAKEYSKLQIPERFTDDSDSSNPVRYYIKGIESKAFYGKDVTSVLFNSRSQMEYIGDYAFSGTKITSISLPQSMKNIGAGSFLGSSITEVELNSGLVSIGEYAFSQTNLTSVSIPETVTAIGNHAFYKTSLANAELKEGLMTIGEYAFANSRLSSVCIPSTVTVIENNTFEQSQLTSVEIKDGPVSIGNFAFADTKITSVIIPKTVREIGIYAFFNTMFLSQVTLQEGLVSIGSNAFNTNFDRSVDGSPIYIPTTVETIGRDAFYYFKCSRVDISDLSAWCNISFDNSAANPLTRCGYLYVNGELLTNLQIPERIEKVKPFTFSGCLSLKEVIIPNSLHCTEEDSFSACSNLISVTFQEGIHSIGPRSFYDCSNLTSISFPKGLQELGINSFGLCSNLTSVIFSDGLKKIGNSSFYMCSKLASVTLPETLEIMEANCFWSCYSIPRLTIPSSVLEIGPYVCPTMSVKFADGNSAIKIDDNAFYRGINNLYWGRPLESMTFSLNDFSSLEFGNNITEIPDGRFSGWGIRTLVIGNGVQVIGNQAFSGCNKIDNLKFGSALKSIGEEAFSGCTTISEVVLPPSLENICSSAFAGNSKLKSIIMGHNVKTIGEKAYDGCPANSVYITAQTPPTAPNNTFSNYTGKLYLQGEKAKDNYYDAFTCWDRFDSYLMIDAEEIKIEGDDNITGKAGDTFQLTATVLPEDATLPQIFWRSTNPELITIDTNGLATLHADLQEAAARSMGESGIYGSCTIIAETLYSDGPVAQVNVYGFKNVEASGISLSESSLEIILGQSATLIATVQPDNATDKTVTWTSSDEAVAKVDAEGNVTALSIGEAVITAACGNVSATCSVTVLPVLIESLSIDPTTWIGVADSEFKITATILPENATDKTLAFKSSDTSVATVDEEGNVKVLKAGSCVITVSTVDGSNLNAECVITGTSGVDAIFANPDAQVDVYDMNGILLKKGCSREELKQLKPAVYIFRCGDTVVKTVLRVSDSPIL